MKKLIKYYILSFVLLFDFVAFAQPADGDETNDLAAAPINNKLILLAIAGVCFIFFYLRKNRTIA